MKTSADLKTDVMDELMFEPSIDETGIGVAVEGGVVTLRGHAKSYAETDVNPTLPAGENLTVGRSHSGGSRTRREQATPCTLASPPKRRRP